MSRPGSLIIVDNVVRNGAVADASTTDASVQGMRRFFDVLKSERRVSATAVQTVGGKGYDGFAVALVVDSGRTPRLSEHDPTRQCTRHTRRGTRRDSGTTWGSRYSATGAAAAGVSHQPRRRMGAAAPRADRRDRRLHRRRAGQGLLRRLEQPESFLNKARAPAAPKLAAADVRRVHPATK